MLVEFLSKGGSKDLLVPYFTFRRLQSTESETQLFAAIARLRYEVYCNECHYLDAADYPNGTETDHLDRRSAHLAAHNLQGELVGTLRLVLAQGNETFPFEEHCPAFAEFKPPPREESAEISRLIVKKNLRRRSGDSLQGVTKEFQEKGGVKTIAPRTVAAKGKNRRSHSPLVLLGLYREIYRYGTAHGVRYLYAAMEKGLARMAERMGFCFAQIGPERDYYGPVSTYLLDLHDVDANLGASNDFLLAWLQDRPISDWLLLKTLVRSKLGRMGRS